MTQTSLDGLKTWQSAYKDKSTLVTTVTVRTVPDANGNSTVTVTYPDASSQVSAYSLGWLTSVKRQDSGGAPVSQTTYQYDAHGRTWQVTDARDGTATTRWNYHPQRGWLDSKDYSDAATGNPPGTEGTGGPV